MQTFKASPVQIPGFTQVVNGSQDLTFSATVTAVPEPASWALMLMGFGAIGYGVRRQRKTMAALAA